MKINSLLAGKYFGIKSDYTCIGNGAAELIKSLMEKLDEKSELYSPRLKNIPTGKSKKNLLPIFQKIIIFPIRQKTL